MKPELLSPAGSMEALRAALKAGADAVYLGASFFGARVSAGFDDEALREAVHLAHLHGRRIYVTVNTLLKQQEMRDVRQLLARLCELRVDAVIVQDLGLVRLIKREFPALCVHASTQMSVHNASGAQVLMDLGISRVVLARECSMADIRQVANTGIETEVFVHGAMCVSFSGQCLLSSQIGGRSGNRGRCAQPCRLQYSYKQQSGALLSMKDMNTLQHVPQLLSAGARSFKIEGRLKRAEYVYLVTSIYRKALDHALRGEPHPALEQDQEALAQVFSRNFTSGHALYQEDSNLLGIQRVSHQGILLGRITKVLPRGSFTLAHASMDSTLNNGDGLQVRGQEEQDLIYSGLVVLKGQTAVLRLRKAPQVGDALYRLQDEAQLQGARDAYQTLPKLPFDASLTLNPGEAAVLEVRHQEVVAACQGEVAQPAQSQPLNADSTRRLIAKAGQTPFVLQNYRFVSQDAAFLPASAINALRRAALEALETKLIQAHPLPKAGVPALQLDALLPENGQSVPKLYAILPMDMDRQAFSGLVDEMIFYPDNYRKGQLARQLERLHPEDLVLLPRQIKDSDLATFKELAEGQDFRLVADNVGQLQLLRPAMAGEGIPVWNADSLRMLSALSVKAALLSRELSEQDILALPRDILELVVPVYGNATVMLLNHCPERLSRSLSSNRAHCRFCERGEGLLGQHLKDRLGCAYPLSPTHFKHGCLIAMHFHSKLHLAEKAPKVFSWLLDLRLERQEDALEIATYYAALMRGELPAPVAAPEPGRYVLGVE